MTIRWAPHPAPTTPPSIAPRKSGWRRKTPEQVDVYVGARIRRCRLDLGVTQAKLAEAISVTLQQVQKYENAINRISASRLAATARELRKPVQWFFPDEFTEDDDNGWVKR